MNKPIWEPDALVKFTLVPTEDGGRNTNAYSGYRPHYCLRNEFFTSVAHHFIEQEYVEPGNSA